MLSHPHHKAILLSAFFLATVLLAARSSEAEVKTITAEATYTMGDGESPAFAESMALQKAKQTALEQAGTYVESYTKIQNFDLTTEEIQTIAGGVVEVEVLEKTRALVADALRFYVKIKATVATDKMEELARRIRGKNIAQEYERLRKDYALLNEQLESLKAFVAKTPQGPEREGALARILEQEKALTELQRSEKVFFKRLLAGENLVREAREGRAMVDQLVQAIRDQGHLVEVGKPVTSLVREADEKGFKADPDIKMQKIVGVIREVVRTEEFQKATSDNKEQLLTKGLRLKGPDFAQLSPKRQQEFVRKLLSDIDRLNTYLDDKGLEFQPELRLDLPITVSISKSLLLSLPRAADSLGGGVYSVPIRGGILTPAPLLPLSSTAPTIHYLIPDTIYNRFEFRTGKHPFTDKRYQANYSGNEVGTVYKRQLLGTMIRLSSSVAVSEYFRERVGKLALMIRLSFSDGSERTCKAPFVVTRIIPVDEYFGMLRYQTGISGFDEADWFVSSLYYEEIQREVVKGIQFNDLWDYASYVGLLSEPISFMAWFRLPEQRVKELRGYEAKFTELKSRRDLAEDVCYTVIDSE